MKTYYVAHDDLAIYGIGTIPDDALIDAADWTDDIDCLDIHRINPVYAQNILENGFGPKDAFFIDQNNMIQKWRYQKWTE